MTLTATLLTGTTVELSGQVTCTDPSTVVVSFSGVVDGSTTPDSSGDYDFEGNASGPGTVTATAQDEVDNSSASASANVTFPSPSIQNLSISYGTGTSVTLSGQVSDADPSTVTVNFSGVASGSTTTNSDGTFSANLQASGVGTIQAVATDSWGLTSDPASVQAMSVPPAIQQLTLNYDGGDTVTVSGQVADPDPASVALYFSGAASGLVTANSDGTFSANLEPSGLGLINAVATDAWGLSSDTASVEFSTAPPAIQGLTLTNDGGGTVTVAGQVDDANPGSVVVSFAGVASGSVTANSDGTFSVNLQPSTLGAIQAVATDIWYLTSNDAAVEFTTAPPAIQGLEVTYEGGNTITVSGQVIDADPAAVVVTFSGVASGSVNANADGTFSADLSPSALGGIQVQATNAWELTSPAASVEFASPPPSIESLSQSDDGDGTLTISGQISDANPGSVVLNFSGAASGSVTANPDGTFSVELPESGSGAVQAVATNMWGLTSAMASTDTGSGAPSIASLSLSYDGGDTVTLSGQVNDADPSSVVLNFSGAASGSVTANADGTFSADLQASALGTIEAVATNAAGFSSAASSVTVASTPPSIHNLAISYDGGDSITVSGQVVDANPSSVVVQFSGAASGSVTANADGTFSEEMAASALGAVETVATDEWGLSSDPDEADVPAAPPSIQNLSISYGSGNTVTLTGQVSDADPGSVVLNFSGAASGSVTANADGTFSLTLQASALGAIQAVATNAWELSSAPASVTVASNPPSFTSFVAACAGGNYWTFSGTVTDESAAGLTVQLSGLDALSGVTTTVAANGSFSVTVPLAPGEQGLAIAQISDWWGLQATPASYLVNPPA